MNNAKKHSSPLIKELKSRIPQHTKDSTERRLSLAARIDDVLQERGLTNQEFAFMMGKKPSEITRWLSGTHNFTTETLWEMKFECFPYVHTVDQHDKRQFLRNKRSFFPQKVAT